MTLGGFAWFCLYFHCSVLPNALDIGTVALIHLVMGGATLLCLLFSLFPYTYLASDKEIFGKELLKQKSIDIDTIPGKQVIEKGVVAARQESNYRFKKEGWGEGSLKIVEMSQ